MAKASLNNGYLRLANALAEQFACRAFTGLQLAILFVVLRNTYGYKSREVYAHSYSQIAQATGIDKSDVGKRVRELLAASVLIERDGMIGLNPNPDEWTIGLRGAGESPLKVRENHPRQKGESPAKRGRITRENEGESPATIKPKSPIDAASVEPKEKKDRIKETPLTPQGGGRASRRDPWKELIASADYFPGEVDFLAEEFIPTGAPRGLVMTHPMKRPRLEAWLKHPRVARERAHQWAGRQSWAQNLFGAALSFLENPGRFKTSETPPVAMPPAQDFTGWRSLLKGKGSWTDDAWLEFQASRAARSGYDIDPAEVRSRCKADGLAVAGPWMWDLLTRKGNKHEPSDRAGSAS